MTPYPHFKVAAVHVAPVFLEELQDDEGILYADIDLAQTVAPRQLHDVAGYYNRFDVFKLSADRTPNRPVWFEGDGSRAEPAAAGEATQAPRRVEE